jgi:hypothetical protein
MLSGYFENGKPAGEWTTYDAKGKAVKVTRRKSPVEQHCLRAKSESPAGGWAGLSQNRAKGEVAPPK